MIINKHFSILSLAVLLALVVAAVLPFAALADDETPPPDAPVMEEVVLEEVPAGDETQPAADGHRKVGLHFVATVRNHREAWMADAEASAQADPVTVPLVRASRISIPCLAAAFAGINRGARHFAAR